jgi:hypothetical protein
MREAATGIKAVAWIPAGGKASYRLTLDREADFVLWCRYTGDHVALIVNGPAGEATIIPKGPGPPEAFRLPLEAGEYVLTAVSTGTKSIYIDWDLILDNGVGQTAAIALPVAPTTGIGGIAPLGAAFAPAAAPATVVGGAIPSAPPLPAIPASPVGLSLLPEPVLIGRPTAFDAHVDVVGPVVAGGAASLADAGSGLSPGVFMPRASGEPAAALQMNSAENRSDAEARSAQADSAALAATEWVERVVASVGWRPSGESGPAIEQSNARGGVQLLETSSRPAEPVENGKQPIQEGSAPIVWLIPVVALAARYRSRLVKQAASAAGSGAPRPTMRPGAPRRVMLHPSGPVSLPRWMRDPIGTKMRRLAH